MKKNIIYVMSFFILFSNFLLAGNNQWEKTEILWNFSIISSCDVGLNSSPIDFFKREESYFNKDDYRNIQSGDIVWLNCRLIPQFYKEVLPEVKHPFVLVITDGDESFPSDCGLGNDVESFISHQKIIHIFAQNNDYKGSSLKISHLPIGLDFHTVAYKGSNGGWGVKGSPQKQESLLLKMIRKLKPTSQRKMRAFVDFQLADTMHGGFKRYLQFGEDRTSIFHQIIQTGLIDHGSWMKRSDLWQKKGQYAFSVSPWGNGLDCHRTWEDLVLGCIVIVKTSVIDPLYEGLPVVIINDWDEITSENMELWLRQYGDALTNPSYREKLTNRYWLNKISEKAAPYKN